MLGSWQLSVVVFKQYSGVPLQPDVGPKKQMVTMLMTGAARYVVSNAGGVICDMRRESFPARVMMIAAEVSDGFHMDDLTAPERASEISALSTIPSHATGDQVTELFLDTRESQSADGRELCDTAMTEILKLVASVAK